MTNESQSNDNSANANSQPVRYSKTYLRSLKELKVLVTGATFFMIWTLVVCGCFGYVNEMPSEVQTTLGMPSWVFWGVVLPWVFAGLFSIWFALFFIKDDDDEFNKIASSNEEQR